MNLKKRITGMGAASVLMFATLAPSAQAAGSSEVFGGQGQTQRLAAAEMAETEGEALCGGACIATGLFVGGLVAGGTAGYLINR